MIREDHYENLKDKKYVTINEARKRSFKIDWHSGFKPGMKSTFFLSLQMSEEFTIVVH